jgi:lipopolysaccharide/colanic/teichoic acid biosynthesis glycosyltransferase
MFSTGFPKIFTNNYKLITNNKKRMKTYKYLKVKKLLDVSIAAFSLMLLFPLFLPIALLLGLTGEGYVFYFQKRIGYKNKHFKMWKFATMLKDSPNMGTGAITLRNDPRVMPMGTFLRKTKLNELPQIINVLKGDLSIVGPRPLVEQTFAAYSEEIQSKINNVKPGITGISSIIFRNEEELISDCGEEPHTYYNKVIAPYKGELELWYQENISFLTDMKIIFLTAWQIISPQSKLVFRIFKDLPPLPAELLPGKTMMPSELEVAIQEEVVVEERRTGFHRNLGLNGQCDVDTCRQAGRDSPEESGQALRE